MLKGTNEDGDLEDGLKIKLTKTEIDKLLKQHESRANASLIGIKHDQNTLKVELVNMIEQSTALEINAEKKILIVQFGNEILEIELIPKLINQLEILTRTN